jgi:hypothetical protein
MLRVEAARTANRQTDAMKRKGMILPQGGQMRMGLPPGSA